jgi:hypothetical protein
MIVKVAESVALRKAFPQQLNGLYTQEEMPETYAATATPTPPKVKPSIAPEPTEQDNSLQLATRKLLEAGEDTFQYDLHGIGNTCTNKENKAELWKEIKAMGGVAIGKVLHSAEALPDFESFEFYRPKNQEPREEEF